MNTETRLGLTFRRAPAPARVPAPVRARDKQGGFLAAAAREPLVQFLAAALVLFATNRLIHGPETRMPQELVTIAKGRVQQIAESYRLLSGRLPSRAELQALVEDFIDEEIDYREAIAMGLDADDTIVRRRMRQKLEFLAEDGAASEEPTDAQLAAWLTSHRANYRLPARVAFRQILASRDTRGGRAGEEASAILGELRSGANFATLGDASMLPQALALTTKEGVATLFGEDFASRVFAHTGEGWFGPLASPVGAHAVLILSREPAHDPTLNEIREKLRSDWIETRRRARRDEFQAHLRERYEVRVDWPEPYASQPRPAVVPRLRRPLDMLSGE
jgi:PPIC-type PPIASE domain